MKNNHAVIDPRTGLVCNVIIWEGKEWTPPKDHYVVHDCHGHMGDYWHQDTNCFYTPTGKRRSINDQGKSEEIDLNDYEKEHILPRLEKVYEHAALFYRWKQISDVTKSEVYVPDLIAKAIGK